MAEKPDAPRRRDQRPTKSPRKASAPAPGKPLPIVDGPRLFFAVELDESTREQLNSGLTRLQKALKFTPLKMQWVPTENFHVTLFFLGNIPRVKADRLRASMAAAAETVPSFSLDVRHLGTFPPPDEPKPPKVLWAGCHNVPPQLHLLRQRCAEIIARAGLPLPQQDFTPHITVARFKGTYGLAAFRQHLKAVQFLKAGLSSVTQLVLMESITGGGPARYAPWATAPLGPPLPTPPPRDESETEEEEQPTDGS